MDYQTLKQNIKKAGLNIRKLATLLEVNPNSISNLSKKEKMPKNLFIITALLAQLKEKGVEPEEAFKNAGVYPSKANEKDHPK